MAVRFSLDYSVRQMADRSELVRDTKIMLWLK